jgi:hypothetical protein
MENVIKEVIKVLAEKAQTAVAQEAMHLTQSALNLAHVLQVIKQTEVTK